MAAGRACPGDGGAGVRGGAGGGGLSTRRGLPVAGAGRGGASPLFTQALEPFDLGTTWSPVSLNPRREMPNFGSGLPLPAPCAHSDCTLFSGLCHLCLFVSGCLVVSPSSPILLPREEDPEVACPLLSHTHTLSLFF